MLVKCPAETVLQPERWPAFVGFRAVQRFAYTAGRHTGTALGLVVEAVVGPAHAPVAVLPAAGS